MFHHISAGHMWLSIHPLKHLNFFEIDNALHLWQFLYSHVLVLVPTLESDEQLLSNQTLFSSTSKTRTEKHLNAHFKAD
jgi:hypothetical protein